MIIGSCLLLINVSTDPNTHALNASKLELFNRRGKTLYHHDSQRKTDQLDTRGSHRSWR